jgi:hypothetical protein
MPDEIVFFDCNATIGRPASPTLQSWLDHRSLLSELQLFGVGEALVSHIYAQELDYREGNEQLLRAIEGEPRLHAVGTVFPDYSPNGGSRLDDLDDLTSRGCVAIRLHPNPTHQIMDEAVYARQFPFLPDVVGHICERLAQLKVPLLVELAQVQWWEVYETCRTFPELPLVLLNVSYTHKRSLFAGLDKFPKLYCDTSTFHAYRGLEEVCELFGPDRILFGTRLPTYNALAAFALIQYAAISAEARKKIAGDNLRRLLKASAEAKSTQVSS